MDAKQFSPEVNVEGAATIWRFELAKQLLWLSLQYMLPALVI
jgi:hypothetical protein